MFNRELQSTFSTISQSAVSGNSIDQLKCYGIGKWLLMFRHVWNMTCVITDYPSECASYFPTHTLDCLNAFWQNIGCVLESDYSPSNINSSVLSIMSSQTLGWIHYSHSLTTFCFKLFYRFIFVTEPFMKMFLNITKRLSWAVTTIKSFAGELVNLY